MDLDLTMSGSQRAQTQMMVDTYNASINEGRMPSTELGRDDFLQILITQLQHQDPTDPMKDKEFIAQMAQFSTLEQMTNLSQDFQNVSAVLSSSQAMGMLGQNVTITQGENTITGQVERITGGEFPQVMVNGRYYHLDSVDSVQL
ncbi:MAG: flagellar hook assembly protein FlgD [Spirochaetia bacterium]